MIKRFSHDRLLHQLGGWYLTILVAIAQIIALLGAIPGIFSVRANVQFEARQLRIISILLPFLIIISILILLGISRRLTPVVRKKLDVWSDNTIRTKPEDDLPAWREITSLSWRYGVASVLVILIIDILPIFFISSSSTSQSAGLNTPDPIYVLIGGTVSLCGSVVFATILIERLMLPLRLILLPKDFESQLKGHSGLLLNGKFLALTLALIVIAILLIAPIGYHHKVI